MNKLSPQRILISGAALCALLGCAGPGIRYSEALGQASPLTLQQTRLVLLRPNGRFDNYSLSPASLRVNEQPVGRLAYGRFLIVDVDAGNVAITASAKNRLYGTCTLRFWTAPGATVYLDVAPRNSHAVADLAGAVAGAAVVGDGPMETTLSEAVVDKEGWAQAAGAAAGGAAASAAESAGKKCGGPFSVTPITASVATSHLEHLTSSK